MRQGYRDVMKPFIVRAGFGAVRLTVLIGDVDRPYASHQTPSGFNSFGLGEGIRGHRRCRTSAGSLHGLREVALQAQPTVRVMTGDQTTMDENARLLADEGGHRHRLIGGLAPRLSSVVGC